MLKANSLCLLADEYFEQAEVLTSLINKKRQELRSLDRPQTSREAYKIKSILNILYSQRRDVLDTARYLKKNYPDDESEK